MLAQPQLANPGGVGSAVLGALLMIAASATTLRAAQWLLATKGSVRGGPASIGAGVVEATGADEGPGIGCGPASTCSR